MGSYNRGVIEARVAYIDHFNADFPRLADLIFGRYYEIALRYHEVPRDSDLWNTPPPSVLTGPPSPDSTQAETETEGEHAVEWDEEVEQPPVSATIVEGVVMPPPPSSEAVPVQQEDFTHFLASPEELAILSRGLSMTSILNEPLQAIISHSAAEDTDVGPELTLGGNLDATSET